MERTLHSHIVTFLIERFDHYDGILGQTKLLLDRVGCSHSDDFVLLLGSGKGVGKVSVMVS